MTRGLAWDGVQGVAQDRAQTLAWDQEVARDQDLARDKAQELAHDLNWLGIRI